MADVLAIVSKAQFEQQAPGAKVGDTLGIAKYTSSHKALEPLRDGGSLFLVTVRPQGEQLWLVAVLDSPKFEGGEWRSSPSTAAIRNIDALKKKLKFASGKGIEAKPGALGMSLQTPRTLTEADAALLRGDGKTKVTIVEANPSPERVTKPDSPQAKAEKKPEPKADAKSLLQKWRSAPTNALADALEDATDEALRTQLAAIRGKKLENTRENVAALEKLCPDPRVARALVDIVRDVPFTSDTSQSTWTVIFDMLVRAGDPRTLSWLPEIRANVAVRPLFQTWFVRRLLQVEAALKEKFPGPIEAAPVPVKPKPPATPRAQSTLLEEIYASPDDDGPRLVLADVLQEKGDPRGEFITMQCQAPDAKRERALLKEHGREWMGELEPYVGSEFEFRRGFLSSATLKQKNERDAKAALELPGWATVEVLRIAGSPGGSSANTKWSQSLPKTLRAVREIYDIEDEGLEALLENCPHIRPQKMGFLRRDRRELWERLQKLGITAKLKEVKGLDFELLRGSPLLDQLTSVTHDRTRLEDEHLDAVLAHPQLTLHFTEFDHVAHVAMKDGLLSVTREITSLGERHPGLDFTGEKKQMQHSIDRGRGLVEALTRPIGLTKIQSFSIVSSSGDRYVVPKALAATEKLMKTALAEHLERLRALREFDLGDFGGKGTRTPAIATVEAVAPESVPVKVISHPKIDWCGDDRLYVVQPETVVVIDANDGRVVQKISADANDLSVVTRDGRILVNCGWKAAYVFDVRAGGESHKLTHSFGNVSDASLSDDGRRLLVLVGDTYMPRRAAALELGTSANDLFTKPSIANGVITRDGKHCILAREDSGKIESFALDDPKAKGAVWARAPGVAEPEEIDPYVAFSLSPSGRTLSLQMLNHAVVVFDVATRAEKARFQLADRIAQVCDDRIVAVASDDGISIHDIATGASSVILKGAARCISLSPDGSRVVARVKDAIVTVGVDGEATRRFEFPDPAEG